MPTGAKCSGGEPYRPAEGPADQLAAALGRQERAAVEGIEEHLLARDAGPGDEMPGQPDALHLEIEPAPHLDQHQGQRDRDAEPAIRGPRSGDCCADRSSRRDPPRSPAPRRGTRGAGGDGRGRRRRAGPARPPRPARRGARGSRRRRARAGRRRRSGGRRGPGGSGRPGDPPPRRTRPATVGVHQHPGAWWMPAVRSAAPCSSSASASVRAEARRAASCVSGGGGQLEQERAAELVMEALVRLDDVAIERRRESVARAVAELDELAVLHHRDGLAGELAGRDPLHGGRGASRGT